MRYYKTKTGYLKLVRKLPEMAVVNNGVGVVATSDPTASCLTVGVPQLSLGASAYLYDVPFSIKFNLAQIINSGDIIGLADKYRIKGAYIRLYYNNSNSSTGTVGGMPFIQYITDHDDAIVPANANVLREKMGVKFHTFKNGSSYIGMYCRPVPNRQLYNGVGVGFEIPNKAPWIDCTNNTVDHFGIKGTISQLYLPAPATAQCMMKFDVALVIEAKDFQ